MSEMSSVAVAKEPNGEMPHIEFKVPRCRVLMSKERCFDAISGVVRDPRWMSGRLK